MVDSLFVTVPVAVILGFLSGLGIGGGSLLILWLTMVLEFPQQDARAINLLFFLPSALLSSLFRWKQGRLDLKIALFAAIPGCIAACLFSWVSESLDIELLKKLFGGLLLLAGFRELLYRPKKKFGNASYKSGYPKKKRREQTND